MNTQLTAPSQSVEASRLPILDSISYAIVAMDTRGRVLYLNQPARDFLKQRGRDFDSCIGGPASAILPIATPVALAALKDPEFIHGRRRIVDKGKELFFEITPLPAGDEPLGAVISLQHPERFEEMACKLKTYQSLFKQLQAVFQSSSDGIWVTDGRGVITNVNRASMELNGLKGKSIIGRNVHDIVAEGGVDQAVSIEVMKHKRQVSLIQHIKNTDRQILATGTPVFDDLGNLALIVVNERDLTELNNLRRDLAIAKQSRESLNNELKNLLMLELAGSGIVAESRSMRRVLASALKLAQLNVSNILLSGESGVGKGVLAKFLHENSSRRESPFLSINCAALPENLFEAELFGYEHGAFTGAREDGRMGLLKLAQDGTLFLDEIGELPLSLQAKLLTCLDQNEFMPIGADKPEKAACTLVFATNRRLESLVRKKRFRKDLYYRLSEFNLDIPPLRERREDTFELARQFLAAFNKEFNTEMILSSEALELLQSHPFPGNVRELRSLIRKGVVMSEKKDLAAYLRNSLGHPANSRPEDHSPQDTLPQAVAGLERGMLLKAMATCSTTREMAESLGISQPTVVRKMARYGLSKDAAALPD